MGSLQDQLLKAGLVSKQKARKTRTTKSKNRKQGKTDAEIDLARAYAQRAREEQSERDRAANAKREEQRLRRERNQQMWQIVEKHAKNDKNAEQARFFTHNEKVRKMFLTPEQLKAVNGGRMGFGYVRGRYFVVDVEVLDRLAAISEQAIGFDPRRDQSEPETSDPAYEDEKFQVPDDLIW